MTETSSSKDRTEPCRVLIVDDDKRIASRTSALLERNGYQVSVAGSGRSALRILNSNTCQIVMTDWRMPDMDGLDLCRKIRRRPGEDYTYVLLLREPGHGGTNLAARSAGADDHAEKGAPAEEILARLDIGRQCLFDR